jgi:hypothetical protein
MAKDINDRLSLTQITSFEVSKVAGDWKAVTGRWHELSRDCRDLANFFWQRWLVHHFQNHSSDKLKAWLEDRRVRGVKAAGKCPVDCLDNKLSNAIYHESSVRFPRLNKRLQVLLLNRLTKTLKSRKASSGSLPGWSAILLGNEGVPSFSRPYPILFDKDNGPAKYPFVPPETRGENWRLRLRVWRDESEDGKGSSPIDELVLWCKGKKVRSQVAILEKIASGEYKFQGSQLVYSKGARKWFVRLCYSRPAEVKPDLDMGKTATLYAGEDCPLRLGLPDGAELRPLGGGHFVGPVRRNIVIQRLNRRQNHRIAATHNSKGHGRTRALGSGWWRLQQRDRDFTKHVNRLAARFVVDQCIARGIGRVVYEQPEGAGCEGKFLQEAGAIGDRKDSVGWPWFELGTYLKQAAQKVGIEVSVVKSCEGSGGDENAGTARGEESSVAPKGYVPTGKKGTEKSAKKSAAKRDRSKKGSQSGTGQRVASGAVAKGE